MPHRSTANMRGVRFAVPTLNRRALAGISNGIYQPKPTIRNMPNPGRSETSRMVQA